MRISPCISIAVFIIPFLPNQHPHFRSRHPLWLGICVVIKPLAADSRFGFQQLQLWLQEIRNFFMTDRDIFKSYMLWMNWKFKFLSSSFSFATLLSDIKDNYPILLYLLIWQTCHIQTQNLTSSLYLILGIQCLNFVRF